MKSRASTAALATRAKRLRSVAPCYLPGSPLASRSSTGHLFLWLNGDLCHLRWDRLMCLWQSIRSLALHSRCYFASSVQASPHLSHCTISMEATGYVSCGGAQPDGDPQPGCTLSCLL